MQSSRNEREKPPVHVRRIVKLSVVPLWRHAFRVERKVRMTAELRQNGFPIVRVEDFGLQPRQPYQLRLLMRQQATYRMVSARAGHRHVNPVERIRVRDDLDTIAAIGTCLAFRPTRQRPSILARQ